MSFASGLVRFPESLLMAYRVSVSVYLSVGLAVFQMEMWVTVSGVCALCG